jgi:hypothetical protein
MNINITVDGLEGVDLSTVIGDEIAYYDPETGETEHRPRTLGDLVAEKLADKIYAGLDYERRNELTKTASAERVKLIRERLVPQVEAALSGEIQKTNNYGEPNGQTTTMRELVIAEITRVINAKGDRHYSDSEKPLITRVVSSEVNRALTTELADAFKAEKDKVVAAVRAKAADLIADAVKQGVGR